jgi:hypothetical protein
MQHRATLRFTEPLIERAVRSFWIRTVGYGEPVVVIVMIALLAWRLVEGDRSWVVGVLATFVVIGVVLPLTIYIVHYRNSLGKFRAMKEPVAEFTAGDDELTLASDLGTTTLKWSSVTELWRFESLWLMLFSKSQFVTIPLDGLPESMREFVLARVRASGGRISGTHAG